MAFCLAVFCSRNKNLLYSKAQVSHSKGSCNSLNKSKTKVFMVTTSTENSLDIQLQYVCFVNSNNFSIGNVWYLNLFVAKFGLAGHRACA